MLGIQGLSHVQNRVDGGKWSSIHKFGSNPTLSGSEETIWSAGGLYPWAALATPQILFVSSAGAADDGTVTIQGLDQDWAVLEETVSLAGSPSQITTINTFRRVFRALYTGVGPNADNITVRTLSHAGTIVAQIDAGKGQTLMTPYTVPAGHIGYLVGYTSGVGKLDNADIFLYVGNQGQNFRIKSEMSVYQSVQHQPFSIPLTFGEKTDIDFRAKGASPNSICTLNYDLVLRRL